MKTELIKTLPYSEVNFRWVSNHYDIHLDGSCIYNGELCQFKTEYPEFDEEKDEWKDAMTEIYKLNWLGKLKWMCKQWLFEKCVGYHWSYGNGNCKRQSFYYRKPQWLYKKLFNWYYGKW